MVTILREVSDEIDVGDNTVYYSRHKIDTIPVSESIQRIVRLKRTITQNTLLSENLNRTLLLRRLKTDTITLSEALLRMALLTRVASDTNTLSESISDMITRYKIVSDTIVLTESIIRRLSLKRTASDTTTPSEGIHIAGQEQTYTRNISDIISLLESIIAVKDEFRKEIHPEQPFYPRVRRSRFQRRFEYMRL